MAVDPLIELHDVNKYYGELHVLQGIDRTVGKGEVVVVIGPSGSGKSTLCRTINRPRLRAGVGMVFRSFDLLAHKAVLRNVSLGRIRVRGRKKEEADNSSRRLLGRVGLADRAPEFPAQLSDGPQLGVPPRPFRHWGSVVVARALATEPKALLFDEPTSGMTMVVVTREMGFARSAANRVAFMTDGRIIEDRAPEGLFTDPHSERAKDSLSRILKR